MKILVGSYVTVSIQGEAGGVRTHIITEKSSLESLGHQVTLFDPWNAMPLREYDLFHLYATSLTTYRLGDLVKRAGMKLAVSPMLDKTQPPLVVRFSNAVLGRVPRIHTHLMAAQKLCDMADMVIARSTAERDFVIDAFGMAEKKVTIVPYGLDTDAYQSKPDLFVESYGSDKFVLTVGNLGGSRKNYLRLIKILGGLGIPAFFIGPIPNNPYATACRREAEKYPNVHLLGFVDREMLMSAYAAADTYCQPSTIEGVGIAVLEAGLLGAKIVVTKNGAPPDYFGQFAEYVNPGSERSIREKLLLALEKPRTPDLEQHLRSHFDRDQVRHKLVEAYEQIL